jgi:hypothetical protein
MKYERRYEQDSPEHHEAYQLWLDYCALGSGYVDDDEEIEWKKSRTYHAAGDIPAMAAVALQQAYNSGRKNRLLRLSRSHIRFIML